MTRYYIYITGNSTLAVPHQQMHHSDQLVYLQRPAMANIWSKQPQGKTNEASKLNSTNNTSSTLRAATVTPETLNNLLSYDQQRPLNQLALVLSKLKYKSASCITSLARTAGSSCIRADPPQPILSKLEDSRLVGY
ncbi:transcription factor IIIB 50 kDa subunit [Dorcoceras hygrometricum]|uniref:Transcription factor IIIB 50 kDa subunit n=1 Tax=Dorcoceras hygrometricum TaxID=472368 RepID=A0A2Z7D965_9LAMI|nr:transcription factor IIIB 50 kDa subunit [Dorcoceras hygrometricum]